MPEIQRIPESYEPLTAQGLLNLVLDGYVIVDPKGKPLNSTILAKANHTIKEYHKWLTKELRFRL